MEKIKLHAENRGEQKAKQLRTQGFVMGTVYGHKIEAFSVQIPIAEFKTTLKKAGQTGLIDLQVGTESIPVLIHKLQRHPITRDVLNVEFYKVSLTEKVTTKIPLHFVGESPAVKLGAYLLENLHEVEIEALPQDIVPHIDVDISVLVEIGHQVTAADLNIPAKIKLLTDPATLVAKTQPPKEATEEEVAEEEVAVAPELITSKKEEEESKEA